MPLSALVDVCPFFVKNGLIGATDLGFSSAGLVSGDFASLLTGLGVFCSVLGDFGDFFSVLTVLGDFASAFGVFFVFSDDFVAFVVLAGVFFLGVGVFLGDGLFLAAGDFLGDGSSSLITSRFTDFSRFFGGDLLDYGDFRFLGFTTSLLLNEALPLKKTFQTAFLYRKSPEIDTIRVTSLTSQCHPAWHWPHRPSYPTKCAVASFSPSPATHCFRDCCWCLTNNRKIADHS